MTRDRIKMLAANHGMLGQMVTTNLLCAFYEKIAPAQRAAAVQEMLAAAKEEGRKEAMGDGEPVVTVIGGCACGYKFSKNDQISENLPVGTKLYTVPPRAMLMQVAEEVYAACEKSQTFTSATRGLDLSAIVDRIAGEQK